MAKSDAIQWYPGHMAKADRQIREKLKLIDTVIEVLDARVPVASRNPDIQRYIRNKNHIILLNKADLADPVQNQKWQERLEKEETVTKVIVFNAQDQKDRKKLADAVLAANAKGKKQLKCLLCGIPNVGKSTVINSLIGKRKTITGNKPGVTKGQQWLITPENIMLLDTPGILWPKFEAQTIGMHLSWIGSIKDTIFEKENIAGELMRFLVLHYPHLLKERYGFDPDSRNIPQAFDDLCQNRGFLLKGGEYDYLRGSECLINDFKNGRLGRVTIDVC